jgi:hypothetical protein
MVNARFQAILADKIFPNINIVTNLSKMCEIFQAALPDFSDGQWNIKRVRIERVYYKFGKRFNINYIVQFSHSITGKIGKQRYIGQMLPRDVAEARFENERHQVYPKPAVGPGIHFFPELNMILWGFPNDPGIKHLDSLIADRKLRSILQRNRHALALEESKEWTIIKTHIVKYVAQDRCTCKHILQILDRRDNRDQEIALFSKTFSHKFDGELLFKLLKELWNANVCRTRKLLIPEPLFFHPETNTIFQRALPGEHVKDKLKEVDLTGFAAKCGKALAGLHQSKITVRETRSRETELQYFDKGMKTLVTYYEKHKSQLAEIRQGLAEKLPGLPPLDFVPNHGAFRLPQLLDVNGEIGLVDFDDFILTDPMSDAGSFIAHLLYLVVKRDLSFEQSRMAIKAFSVHYSNNASWGLPEDVLRCFVVMALIGKHAKKCVQLAKQNHTDRVEELVYLAADILNGREKLL